ncbi:MAG: hypothetical protein R2708_16955 [Vicinamibacterales bacterium]
MAKERGLEQVGRQVAGVDGDERLVGTRRVAVDGPGHELLARAALARDEYRRPAGGGLDDQVEHLPHLRAAADDARELVVAGLQALLEREVLGDEAAPLDGVVQHDEDLVVLERLRDVVEGAPLHGAHGGLHRRVGRDHDHGQFVVDGPNGVEHLQPVHAGHHQVDDDGIDRRGPDDVESFGP